MNNGNELHELLRKELWDWDKILTVLESDRGPALAKETDDDGDLPLHTLIRHSHIKYQEFESLVNLLVEKNPDSLSTKNDDGDLPIHTAARNSKGVHPKVTIKILSERYANGLKIKNKKGSLPIHLAAADNNGGVMLEFAQRYPEGVNIHDHNKKNDYSQHPIVKFCQAPKSFSKSKAGVVAELLEISASNGVDAALDLRRQNEQLKEEKKKLETSLASLAASLASSNEEKKKLETSLASLKEENVVLAESLASMNEEKNHFETLLASVEEETNQLKKENEEKKKLETSLASLEEEKVVLAESLASVNEEKNHFETLLASVEEETNQLKEENKKLKKDNETLAGVEATTGDEKRNLQIKMVSLEEKLATSMQVAAEGRKSERVALGLLHDKHDDSVASKKALKTIALSFKSRLDALKAKVKPDSEPSIAEGFLSYAKNDPEVSKALLLKVISELNVELAEVDSQYFKTGGVSAQRATPGIGAMARSLEDSSRDALLVEPPKKRPRVSTP